MVTRLVLDASVVLKWIIQEPDSDVAQLLRTPEIEGMAPDLLPVEVTHGLRGRYIRRLLSHELVVEAVSKVPLLPVQLVPSRALVTGALDFAIRTGSSVYDALYAVLALREGCQYVTADRRFYETTAVAFPKTMVFIGQVPELLE